MSCNACKKELTDQKITVEKNRASSEYCSLNCLHQDTESMNFKHRNLSEIVLNKTLFEVLALITGLGGVYYTIYDSISSYHNAALVLDTISVTTALLALFIGVEHLRYVEEHQLVKRGVIFLSIVSITVFIILVWHYGFRNYIR
jgi:hypothetical protein